MGKHLTFAVRRERKGQSHETVRQALSGHRHCISSFDLDRYAERCPGCGGRVLMPCLLCGVSGPETIERVDY